MNALSCCEKLLAIAVFLQAWELLRLRESWRDSGVWNWATLRELYAAFPQGLRSALDTFLDESGYLFVLRAQLACSVCLLLGLERGLALLVILAGTWLTSLRWVGRFNGGSDSMTAIVALCLWLARLWPGARVACSGYIAIQLTASYLIAGISKIRNPEWRQGRALSGFIKLPGYDSPPPWFRRMLSDQRLTRTASIAVLGFECAFPLAWIGPQICASFLAIGLGFHLLCFRVFGLNRFVFAWLAAYPALLYWSSR